MSLASIKNNNLSKPISVTSYHVDIWLGKQAFEQEFYCSNYRHSDDLNHSANWLPER